MFWNIAKKDLSEAIATACRENEVDILILAECSIPEVTLLPHLNGGNSRQTYTRRKRGRGEDSMTEKESFWIIPNAPQWRTPIEIFREQAAFLLPR
jgi:hypothetical protein